MSNTTPQIDALWRSVLERNVHSATTPPVRAMNGRRWMGADGLSNFRADMADCPEGYSLERWALCLLDGNVAKGKIRQYGLRSMGV